MYFSPPCHREKTWRALQKHEPPREESTTVFSGNTLIRDVPWATTAIPELCTRLTSSEISDGSKRASVTTELMELQP